MAASRLNSASKRYDYPREIIHDEAGQVIRPGVRSYGARGLEPAYYLDELNEIVEIGFLKKVNFYKEKKTADVVTQLALIDERLADLTFDGKEFMRRLVNSAQSEKDTRDIINGVASLVGLVSSLIGTPATGSAVTAGLKALGNAIYLNTDHIDRYKKKINALEKEANYLLITKNKLTGEYNKLSDAEKEALNALSRSSGEANNNNTIWYILIAVVVIIIIRKRAKK